MSRNEFSEDVRFQLAAAAASSERSNRPRALLVLAVGLLAVAAVYLFVQYRAVASARQETARVQWQIELVQTRVAQLDAVRATEAEGIFDGDPQVAERIRSLAVNAGITLDRPIGQQSNPTPAEGVVRRYYTAFANGQDIAAVIQWLDELAAGRVSGVAIQTLRLQPGAHQADGSPGWNIELQLTRLERRST